MINRVVAPPFVEPAFFPIKKASSDILEGGIPFHCINSGNTELIRLEIIFKAGKWYQEKEGQAVLTSKMLLEGTKSYTSNEISSSFERNGAFFEISSGMDYINFTVYSLNKNLEKILPVINEIMTVPVFPDKELETLKSIQIQNLKINQKKNNFQASQLFRKNLFGADHPYGKSSQINDIEQLSKDNIEEFFHHTIKNNFEVIVAGMISEKDQTLLKQFFGKFKRTNFEENKSIFPSIKPSKKSIEINDSLQTSLKIGTITFQKSHPEYPILLIFNEILGGYFGSRLMQKIREEKGYSYGIHSSIIQHANEAYFIISSEVIKKYKSDAIHSIYDEIKDLIDNKVPQEELETVKNYFKGSFLSSINSPYALADKFKNIHFNNLSYDFYESIFKNIDDINPDSLQDFAQRNFQNIDFTEVSVG